MAESFYGGRRGASVVIVKSYDSIAEMQAEFDSVECTVDYDSYVVVNTNVDGIESSVLYRRTLDGPVKVGTLGSSSGGGGGTSSGGILDLVLTTPSSVPTPIDGQGEYSKTNKSLVPGYYTDEEGNPAYNDSIKWVYTNVISEDGASSKTYVGFTFPYSIVDFEASLVDKNDENNPVIKRIDDGAHPFYNKWALKIPRGQKGNSFKNLRVVSASWINAYFSNGFADGFILQDDNPDSQHLIYDYQNEDSGELETYYLGKYSIISNVLFSDDGTLSFVFNGNKTVSYTKKVKWISSVNLSEDGTLTFEYNNGEAPTVYEKVIKTIKDISLLDDGTFTIIDNQGNEFKKELIWPTSIMLESASEDTPTEEGSGSQKLKVTYNNGDFEYISPPINYIMRTAIDENYHLLILYSDPEKRANLINKASYDGRDDWEDMGSVKSDNGLLIGRNYTYFGTQTIDVIISSLNANYPNGLIGEDKGKVITAGTYNNDKNFFAYDYDENTWYYLGSLSGVTDFTEAFLFALENDADIESKKSTLKNGGVWFVIEEI